MSDEANYVVREGLVKGEGRYLGRFTSLTTAAWATQRLAAARYKRRFAFAYAGKFGGRVVRLVTLSQQLRKANEEINQLLENGRMEARQGFHEGRQWERERIMEYVQWRSEHRKHWGPVTAQDIEQELHLRQRKPYRDGSILAKMIENGEHKL